MRLIHLAAALIAFAPAAALADMASEVSTAATHAGLAASADSQMMTQTHLRHALNCVVGPAGQGFDAKALNPCKNSGNGAIPDAAGPADKTALEGIAAELRSAIALTSDKAAKAAAAKIAGELKALK